MKRLVKKAMYKENKETLNFDKLANHIHDVLKIRGKLEMKKLGTIKFCTGTPPA